MRIARLTALILLALSPLAQAQAPADPAADPAKPLAVVNGKEIPALYGDLVKREMAQGQADSPQLTARVRESLINLELRSHAALDKGLDKDANLAALLDIRRKDQLAKAYLEDYVKAHPVTDVEIQAAYDKAKAEAVEPEYRARHILVKTEAEAKRIIADLGKKAFQYQNRPDAFDDYRPSFSARMDQRLARIEVRSQGRLVRAYNFAYEYEAADLLPAEAALQSTYLDLGITLLKRVVQVDRSCNDLNYLPPLVFTYSGLDLTKAEQRSFTSPPELDLANPDGRVQLVDLDGDSMPDLFATTLEGPTKVQRAALNRGETRVLGEQKLTFAAAKAVIGSTPIDLAEPNTVVHDPKGKGLVDLYF